MRVFSPPPTSTRARLSLADRRAARGVSRRLHRARAPSSRDRARRAKPRRRQLLMPAWTESGPAGLYLGAKIVNVFPGNATRGLPAVHGLYVLQSGGTGETLAALDGTRLTHWRTAAASALAARYLAAPGRQAPAVVGAGALAPFLARAHASQRADRDDRGLEPPPRGRATRRRGASRAKGLPRPGDRRPRGRASRGRRHLLRDAVDRAADRRRLARARPASRPRRRLHLAACARPTTRR